MVDIDAVRLVTAPVYSRFHEVPKTVVADKASQLQGAVIAHAVFDEYLRDFIDPILKRTGGGEGVCVLTGIGSVHDGKLRVAPHVVPAIVKLGMCGGTGTSKRSDDNRPDEGSFSQLRSDAGG